MNIKNKEILKIFSLVNQALEINAIFLILIGLIKIYGYYLKISYKKFAWQTYIVSKHIEYSI